MDLHRLHDWDLDYAAARRLQSALRDRVVLRPFRRRLRLAAGADMSIDPAGGRLHAAVVVLSLPGFELVEERSVTRPLSFPYIPGLLSFREAPGVLECFEQVRAVPDVVIMDGQGIAHPRGLGLAAHTGLWLGIPVIGCAKSRLVGEYDEPGPERGDWSPLRFEGRRVGAVLRTRTGVRPVFVSPGHLIDVASSVRVVLGCSAGYRLPEPTRLAHQCVTRLRRR